MNLWTTFAFNLFYGEMASVLPMRLVHIVLFIIYQKHMPLSRTQIIVFLFARITVKDDSMQVPRLSIRRSHFNAMNFQHYFSLQ